MNVIIAEDNESIFTQIKTTLEEYIPGLCASGYGTSTITDALISKQLLILDLDYDGKRSLDLLRQIRHQSNIPILVVAHMDDDPDRLFKALEFGANEYVFKPLIASKLLAQVKLIMKGRGYAS